MYLFFSCLLQNIDCRYSLELPRQTKFMFWAKIRKISKSCGWKFSIFKAKKYLFIAWASFRNEFLPLSEHQQSQGQQPALWSSLESPDTDPLGHWSGWPIDSESVSCMCHYKCRLRFGRLVCMLACTSLCSRGHWYLKYRKNSIKRPYFINKRPSPYLDAPNGHFICEFWNSRNL